MGRKGGNRGLPAWYINKGKKIYDDIDGSEIYERSPRTMTQRGLKMDKINFDTLTEQQRQEQIKRR